MKNIFKILTNTRTILLLSSILFLSNMESVAQNKSGVGIGTTGVPNEHAILELEGNKQGILFPKISSLDDMPTSKLGESEKGLVIYNEETNNIHYWNGQKWIEMKSPETKMEKKILLEDMTNRGQLQNSYLLKIGGYTVDMVDYLFMSRPDIQIDDKSIPAKKIKAGTQSETDLTEYILVSKGNNTHWTSNFDISKLTPPNSSDVANGDVNSYLVYRDGNVEWENYGNKGVDNIKDLIDKIEILEQRIEALEALNP